MVSCHVSPRINALLKPPYHQLDDPWYDSFPSLNSFLSRGKDLSKSPKTFHLFMKVNQFEPGEIDVKLVDGFVVVEAKHEDEPNGCVSRRFKGQYKVPDGIDPATLDLTFNDNGLIIARANKKVPEEVLACVELQKPLEEVSVVKVADKR